MGDFFPAAANATDIQRARYKNLHQFETMYIMADLETETLLFTLKYRSNDGLLLIYPDLNSIEANPYLIEINADTRNLYQFAIEHQSVDGSNEIAQLRNDIEVMANKVEFTSKFDVYFDNSEFKFISISNRMINYSYRIYAFVRRYYSIYPTNERPRFVYTLRYIEPIILNTMTSMSTTRFIYLLCVS